MSVQAAGAMAGPMAVEPRSGTLWHARVRRGAAKLCNNEIPATPAMASGRQVCYGGFGESSKDALER